MDEARAVVADFCEKNPYLLGALPMTWFWQKDPIPEANPEEKIKPAPV